MDGVVSAGVELVVPLAARPGLPQVPSKASALLRVNPSSRERVNQQREQLKALIAGSVEGLKADDVALVIDPVESHVQPIIVDTAELARLRVLTVVLASLLTLVSMSFVGVMLQLRRASKQQRAPRPPAKVPATPPLPPKPVI